MTSKFWQDVEELAALNQRRWPVAQSRYVLLELQRMAAEKYAASRDGRDMFARYMVRISRTADASIAAKLAVDAQGWLARSFVAQADAAALSKLVRIGLGIEPAEER